MVAKSARKLIDFLDKHRDEISPLLIMTHDYPDPDAIASCRIEASGQKGLQHPLENRLSGSYRPHGKSDHGRNPEVAHSDN